MKYRIEISSLAEAEADRAFLSLSRLTSPAKASQWHGGLLAAIESLSVMPSWCPLARENEYFSQEIRQLIYGKGRAAYRIIFTILETEAASNVRILHIRHSSQPAVGEEPEAQNTN
jgi:plasmid stabilization system protein ParE